MPFFFAKGGKMSANVRETNKFKKFKTEYQYRLYHNEEINKSKMAKKYGLSIQGMNNWILRYDLNDLTDYIDVPAIIAKNEVVDRSNSKYTQDVIESVYFYASAVTDTGELKYKTQESIREKLELSKSTFSKYMNKKEFEQAYLEGRKTADKSMKKYKLENALLKVALGHKKITTKQEGFHTEDGTFIEVKAFKTDEYVAPNVKALELGLNKFAPGEYDKKPIKEEVPAIKNIDWENLSKEEIKELANGNFGAIKGGK